MNLLTRLFDWGRNGGFFHRFALMLLIIATLLGVLFGSLVALFLFVKIFGWWSVLLLPVLGLCTWAGCVSDIFGESDAQKAARAAEKAKRGW